MPCYKPITAWKPLEGGAIHFSERKNCREIEIPCGQCIGCRIQKREAWAVRCYAESKLHANNHFVTLTYSDEHLPKDASLDYRHIQLFHHSLRKKLGPFRFFVCGEYGDQTARPHYHALYFGLDIPDLVKCNSVYSRNDIYQSEILDNLWKRGAARIGQVTYASARYCAVYTCKKVGGPLADERYARIDMTTGETWKVRPEFARMSLKPGIGMRWLEKYWQDIFVSGANAVVMDGTKKSIPRFFMDKMEGIDPDLLEAWKCERLANIRMEDFTAERLETRETVAKAKESFNLQRKGNLHAL